MTKPDTEKLSAIIREEMRAAVGKSYERLSQFRTELKGAYLGDPMPHDERRRESGWSTAQDRSVLETVEWAKPSLLRVFASQEEIVRFEPRRVDGEKAAEEATDYINQVVFGAGAFQVVYDLITDALYQRVGWAKVWWDENIEILTDEREGLTYEEAQAWLVSQPELDPEGLDVDQYAGPGGAQLFRVKVRRREDRSGVRVISLPSERVVWTTSALDVATARFVAHWEDKSRGELEAEGYAKEKIDNLGVTDSSNIYPETRIQTLVNENQWDTANRPEVLYRVYEGYVRTDGPKGPERWKVVFTGNVDKVDILSVDEWPMDRPPLFPVSSVPLPHSVAGLCLADLILDIQRLRTELFRQLLDSLAAGNQGEIVVNRKNKQDKVDYDQLLNRRIGGVYETEGDVQIMPLPVGSGVAEQAAGAVALTDKLKESRTGVGQQLQGLSADTLQNTATGAAIMDEAVNQRLELIARILAENLFKPIAQHALKLMIRHQAHPLERFVKGRFLTWNPRTWDPLMEVKVSVGLGSGNQGRRIGGLSKILELQEKIAGALKTDSPVRLTHIITAAHKLAQALGFESPEQFFGTIDDARKSEARIMAQAGQQNGQGQTPEERLIEMEVKKGEAQVTNRLKENEVKLLLSQRKAEADINLEQQKQAMDLEFKKAELQAKIILNQEEMIADQQLAAEKARSDAALAAEKARLDAELAVLKETLKAPAPTPPEVIL